MEMTWCAIPLARRLTTLIVNQAPLCTQGPWERLPHIIFSITFFYSLRRLHERLHLRPPLETMHSGKFVLNLNDYFNAICLQNTWFVHVLPAMNPIGQLEAPITREARIPLPINTRARRGAIIVLLTLKKARKTALCETPTLAWTSCEFPLHVISNRERILCGFSSGGLVNLALRQSLSLTFAYFNGSHYFALKVLVSPWIIQQLHVLVQQTDLIGLNL